MLYRGSLAHLADIRLIHNGIETPYEIEVLRGVSEEREVPAAILNQAAVPGEGVRFTLESRPGVRHDRVRIGAERHDFKQRVRIETSDDARAWAIARDDGAIFDVSQTDRPASDLVVTYPVSTARFVRVTVFGWNEPKSVHAAWLSFFDRKVDRRETAVRLDNPTFAADPAAQSSVLIWNLGKPGQPHDAIRFEIEPGLFARGVEVGGHPGTIYRRDAEESLTVTFPERWERDLTVRILNRDDQPLKIRRLELQSLVRYLRFRGEPQGEYWLYYGLADARTPSYDLAALGGTPNGFATLEPQQPNPEMKNEPRPLTDRYPALLYSVMTAAIIGIGYLAVRFLGKVESSSTSR